MENNNKRKNDGRKYNKRKGRVKMIKNDGQVSKPQVTKAKKDRAKQLSQKAIKNVFGNEDAIWDEIAKAAKNGSYKHLEMLMNYSYGKSGENRSDTKPQLKAPVIQFINNTGEQTKQIDNTIDIDHEEE
jgi:hypothetical protein